MSQYDVHDPKEEYNVHQSVNPERDCLVLGDEPDEWMAAKKSLDSENWL